MRKVNLYFGIVIILIGLGLIVYPFYFHAAQEEEIEEVQTAINAISRGESIETSRLSPELRKQVESEKAGLRLQIPSIELNQPILPETNEETLNVALTQIKDNQTPGEGNFTIAGHRSTIDGRHFNRLPDVTQGEKVIILDGGTEYHYEITNIETIEPDRIDILDDVEGKELITLVTCTVTGTKRVIVQGELEKVIPTTG